MNEGFFKRMNFFKGFFTQAEDWQAAEKYHIEKRKLHNRRLHTPGICGHDGESLMVLANAEGSSLRVEAGTAIDGEGRELHLPEPADIPFYAERIGAHTTAYVVIRYGEEVIDRRENSADPAYSGHAFVRETPTVEMTPTLPDDREAIELARIKLENRGKVRNARDPDNPGANEIDLRYVKRAGARVPFSRLFRTPPELRVGEYRDGHMTVPRSKEPLPSLETDASYEIETVEGRDRHRLYLVSAYPELPGAGEARIVWFIASTATGTDRVEYKLVLKNLGTADAKVFWRVYRMA